ncbi:MAG: histidine phosphatase family protein [Paracoccus sp. (in: a-proteobacteria)]|nr:histidine phosphatase family protein [Paracoccus sp. (in: a-proteobacteria)]
MRHGETEANARDMICGRTDLALTPRGLDQARQAADALRGSGIEVVLTSPLMRARQTAETIAGMLGLAPINIAGLAERNWGAWEGAPQATLRRDDTPPGGEAPVIFHDRIARAFRALDLAGSTLIVAHSGTAREIRRLLPPAEHDRMQNGEIRRWICAGGRWTCHEFFKPAP